MILRIAITLILLAPSLAAQAPAPAELINQLVANAEQYRSTLPSLTADEVIATEGSYLGMFKDHTSATGTMRVVRASPDAPLKESRQIVTLNGKPVDPKKPATLPVVLYGGFGLFQDMFFTRQHIACFDFTLLPAPGPGGTLQLAVAGRSPEPSQCPDFFETITGAVTLDPATHQVVHFERTVPDKIANKARLASFASVDSAPVKVGETTFQLPTVVVARLNNGNIRGQFTAHYSNYHRYTASITLLPGATEVQDPTSPDPAPTPPPSSTPR